MKTEDIYLCVDLLLQKGHVDVARRLVNEFKDKDKHLKDVWRVIKPAEFKISEDVNEK